MKMSRISYLVINDPRKRVWMFTFVHTSSCSHLAKSFNKYLRRECKPGIKTDDRKILIEDNKKLILENFPLCFQVTIYFSSYLWQTVKNTPFLTDNVIHFCHPTPLSLKNGHASPKIIFHGYFGKYCFFFLFFFQQKLINEKYLEEPHFLQKSYCF